MKNFIRKCSSTAVYVLIVGMTTVGPSPFNNAADPFAPGNRAPYLDAHDSSVYNYNVMPAPTPTSSNGTAGTGDQTPTDSWPAPSASQGISNPYNSNGSVGPAGTSPSGAPSGTWR